MNMRLLLMAAGLLALAGCSTFERRVAEKAAVFAALTPAQQDNLRKGVVELGYTPDMVYIALGPPDSKRETITARRREETWIYRSFSSDYVGDRIVGYQRYVAYDPKTKTMLAYSEPVRQSVYRDHSEDRIRITFRDSKVAVIEQVKPGR